MALMANGLHLCSMYLVKTHPVLPGDNFLFRGFLQTAFFGLWSVIHRFGKRKAPEEEEQKIGFKLWFVATLTNLGMALVILICFIAIKLMPLSDFIVFAFTAPIFTLVTSAFVLRTRVTVLSVVLVFCIICGAGLVAQPTFIFGQVQSNGSAANNKGHKDNGTYALGTILAFLVALGGGSLRVLQAYCKRIPSPNFLFLGGVLSLLLGATTPACGIPNQLLSGDFRSVIESSGVTLFLISTTSLAGALLLLMAVKVTDPVLISVVRSTEIVMGLLVDVISNSVDYGSDVITVFFWYKVIGAVVVTASVMAIAVSDKIYDKLMDKLCTKRPNRQEYQVISEEGENDDSISGSEDCINRNEIFGA